MSRQWEPAAEAFEGMRAAGVEPNKLVYDLLIRVYEVCGQWERVVEMKAMRAAAFPPKIPDWPCPKCNIVNFGHRSECTACQTPRVGVRNIATEWSCDSCGNSNFARRTSCNRCKAPRSDGGGGAGYASEYNSRQGGGGAHTAQSRMGDKLPLTSEGLVEQLLRAPRECDAHQLFNAAVKDNAKLTVLIDLLSSGSGERERERGTLTWLWDTHGAWAASKGPVWTGMDLEQAFSSAIRKYGEDGQMDRALWVFEAMRAGHVRKPNIKSYNNIFNVLWHGAQRPAAIQLTKEALAAGVYPDSSLSTSTLTICNMSPAAAMAALTLWLARVEHAMRDNAAGEVLPETFTLTAMGYRQRFITRGPVQQLLQTLDAPLVLIEAEPVQWSRASGVGPVEKLVATQTDMRDWMESMQLGAPSTRHSRSSVLRQVFEI